MVIICDALISQFASIFERKSTGLILVGIMGIISAALGRRLTRSKINSVQLDAEKQKKNDDVLRRHLIHDY